MAEEQQLEDVIKVAEELRDLREMRERAGTLYSLPGDGDHLDTMRAAGAFVIMGDPFLGEVAKEANAALALHRDNRRRARSYVSAPELCTKEGLLEWLQYFIEVPCTRSGS